MIFTRREFVKTSAIGAAGILAYKMALRSAYAAANSGNLLKWIQPLRGLTALGDPNGIPVASGTPDLALKNTTFYQMVAGEFTDVLHPQLGPTKLWGYWDATNPIKRHLGGLIVATRNQATRLRMTNTLPTTPIVPVDTTLPGANQALNRIAIHLHGGFIPWLTDGGPFDWWTPAGVHGLSFQNGPGSIFDNIPGNPILPGQADYYYGNDQSTRLMWYHDHAHGITRTNAYSGLATGYLCIDPGQDALLGANLPPLGSTVPLVFQDKVFVTANTQVTDPTWDIGLRPPGSLWYDHVYDPAAFRLLTGGNYILPPDPSCIPEFFGDTMLCNGTVFPLLTVEAKRYRFLMLNACNARFLNVNTFVANPGNPDGIDLDPVALFPTNPAGPNMIQIGTEGGYLASEVVHVSPAPFNPATNTGNMLLAPAERADFIVDFTGLAGQEIILYNDAPGPFPGGPPTTDYYLGNPLNPVQPLPGTGPDTRQILRIKVIPALVADPQPATPILNPLILDPAPIAPIINVTAPIAPLVPPAGTPVRDLTLNESFDQYGRLKQLIGTTKPGLAGKGFGLDYLAAPTEVVNAGSTEVWRIFNLTADTHPLHFHLVNVQVLSRQPFRYTRGRFLASGTARGPEPNELGWKETVQMHPGEVTTVIMRYDMPAAPVNVANVPLVIPSSNRATLGLGGDGLGLLAAPGVTYHEYVWHCHILEHEEHDMMRPLIVKS